MVIVVGIVLCLIMASIGLKTEKKIFNPITIFCGLWCVIIILSSLQLYGLYLAENSTYIAILIGICMYFVGYYVTRRIKKQKIKVYRNITVKRYYELKYKLMYFMLAFSILFLLKDFMSIILKIGLSFDLSAIQGLMQGDDTVFERSSIETAVRLLIVNPFIWICAPITIVDFWMGKRDKKLIVLTIVLVTLKILTTGGRAMFIQLAFYFVCVFTLANNSRTSNLSKKVKAKAKKNKKIFILCGIAGVGILYILTYSRAGQAAMRTIYYDFAMQPYMLQSWMEIADAKIIGLGTASLNGFLTPIDYLLRNTIRVALPQPYGEISELIALTDTKWIWIGNGVRANAYTSAFWFFYVDGRIWGIAIISCIYGMISQISYRKLKKNMSTKNMAVYCMIIVSVFYTFGRFQFTLSNYALGLVYLILFAYKRKGVKIQKKEVNLSHV